MPEPATNPHVARHVERTRRRRLGDRQRAVLAFAQARHLVGRTFPTDAEIMARFPANFRNLTNVRECLLSLQVRGLLEAVETGWSHGGRGRERIVTKWAIAEAAWQVPLYDGEIGR
jgi:hypothetical protein